MKSYDDYLRGNDTHSHHIPNAAITRTLHKCKGSFSTNERMDIHTASENASEVAKKYLAKENDSEIYKSKFKEIYSAALRVELYRQFVAQGQKIHNVDEIIGISKAIKSYIDSESKNIPTAVSDTLVNSLKDFENKLRLIVYGPKSDKDKLNKMKNAALQFELEAMTLIQESKIKYDHDVSWWPFFANLMLVVLGVGIGSFIYRGFNDHYLFADYKTEPKAQDHLVVKDTVNYLKDFGFFNPADAKVEEKKPIINTEPKIKKTLPELWQEARKEIDRAILLFRHHLEDFREVMPRSYACANSFLPNIENNDNLQVIFSNLKKLENSVSYLKETDQHTIEVMSFVKRVDKACEPITNFVEPEIDAHNSVTI